MKEKMNNKGFSLVEILIAITILSIIIAPIAYLFFASAQFVSTSEEVGGKTQIANNIAEQFSAMDFEEWQEGGAVRLQSQSGMVTGSFVTPAVSPAVGYIGAVQPENAPYYISFNAVNAGYSEYNAVVTLQTDGYAQLNNAELFDDISMDYMAVQNRVPTQDPDTLAWQAFMLECTGEGYSVSDEAAFKERVVNSTRTITVDVTDNSGKVEVSANYSYIFTYPAAVAGESVDASVVGTQFNLDNISTVSLTPENGLNMPASGEKLSFYMLFYPWYSETGSDNIIVNNPDNLPIDLAVVKQIDEQIALDLVDFAQKESSYKARLNVFDRYVSQEVKNTVIRSNLSKNLADLNSNVPITNVKHSYGTVDFTPESLTSKAQSERVFNVTIELFDINADGTSDYASGAVYTLSTTVVQ